MINRDVTSDAIAVPMPKKFRHDINGLRAIAVVAVVLYHFGIPGFAGGFVGVDVFFVISGFLMTGIIIRGLERETFSLLDFYLARARRIVPALLVLCASLLLIGWFFLPSQDYKLLSGHVATALTFISNIKFWREAGYFDEASHDKWLLHTWSLSVEWQFYVLLPIGCMMLWRMAGKRFMLWTLLLIGLGSLLLALYASKSWPVPTFFLLPTRMWEMLAGGLVWWITRSNRLNIKLSSLMEGVGLLLILLAVVVFDSSMPWPGPAAIVPVLGAMLVLGAQRQDSFWTANRISSSLGASSYSIYLWHWPLVVALNFAGEQNNLVWIVASLILTVVLGELSLRLVENPARKGLAGLITVKQSSAIAIVVIGLSAIAVVLWASTDKPWMKSRLDGPIELVINEGLNFNPRKIECLTDSSLGFKSPLCRFGNGDVKAVVLGDSHADASVSAVAAAGKGVAIELTSSGCPTVFGLKRFINGSQCPEFNSYAIDLVNNKFENENIIVINRSALAYLGANEIADMKPESYFDHPSDKPNDELNKKFHSQYVKTVCSIKNSERVYLVRPYPEMGVNVPKAMGRALLLGRNVESISISLDEYHDRHKVMWDAQDDAARSCGVHILDPLPYLCHDGKCWGSKNGRPIYYDDDHLSEYGNKLLIPMFKQVWE